MEGNGWNNMPNLAKLMASPMSSSEMNFHGELWCVGFAHHLRHLEKQQIIYTKGMKNAVLLSPSSPCDFGFFLSPPVGQFRPMAAVLSSELNETVQQQREDI